MTNTHEDMARQLEMQARAQNEIRNLIRALQKEINSLKMTMSTLLESVKKPRATSSSSRTRVGDPSQSSDSNHVMNQGTLLELMKKPDSRSDH